MFEFSWHIAEDLSIEAGSGSQVYSNATEAAQACFDFTEEHSLMLMTHDWNTISYSHGMRFHQDCYNTMLRVEGDDWEVETEVLAFIRKALIREWDEGFQADHNDGESTLSIKQTNKRKKARPDAKAQPAADRTLAPQKKKNRTIDTTSTTKSQ
tara:strand:- start:188 stop:649 length:462 start_codon:yes stop_codon:yes gene_type:complete